MWRELPKLKDLDVFKITEELEDDVEEGTQLDAEYSSATSSIEDMLELLQEEIARLGKAQARARMSAELEYKALHEAISALSTDDHFSEEVINDLLLIADGLEAGIRASEAISDPGMDSWLVGMKMVHQRVVELLGKFNVQPIYSLGKLFDPSLHVAVGVDYTQGLDDNTIIEEHRRGYLRNGRVIRYAEVTVNKNSTEAKMEEEW